VNEAPKNGLDLSGDWTGVYSYPGLTPPISFTARLSEQAGSILGVVEERSTVGLGPPRRLGATIQGRRTGFSVTWLKLYDDLDGFHDAVQYEGAVAQGGEEISGRWSIFGNWSGTFLMVRNIGTSARRERRTTARP
jgi:hypothetical protein